VCGCVCVCWWVCLGLCGAVTLYTYVWKLSVSNLFGLPPSLAVFFVVVVFCSSIGE